MSLLPQPGTGRWIDFHRILTHWRVCEITDQRHWLIGCKDHLTASEEEIFQHCAFARGWFCDLSREMSIWCSQSPKTFTSTSTLPMFRLYFRIKLAWPCNKQTDNRMTCCVRGPPVLLSTSSKFKMRVSLSLFMLQACHAPCQNPSLNSEPQILHRNLHSSPLALQSSWVQMFWKFAGPFLLQVERQNERETSSYSYEQSCLWEAGCKESLKKEADSHSLVGENAAKD